MNLNLISVTYSNHLEFPKFIIRYIPSLQATFTFPQCLGILGGKPGASTYIVGVQEENVFYLDPHDVQPVNSLIALYYHSYVPFSYPFR